MFKRDPGYVIPNRLLRRSAIFVCYPLLVLIAALQAATEGLMAARKSFRWDMDDLSRAATRSWKGGK